MKKQTIQNTPEAEAYFAAKNKQRLKRDKFWKEAAENAKFFGAILGFLGAIILASFLIIQAIDTSVESYSTYQDLKADVERLKADKATDQTRVDIYSMRNEIELLKLTSNGAVADSYKSAQGVIQTNFYEVETTHVTNAIYYRFEY